MEILIWINKYILYPHIESVVAPKEHVRQIEKAASNATAEVKTAKT